ncbi:hypothetical protein HDU92_004132 [Lobulomyces angularis]|nr:hypothetical protein HDU92_004132 [Lobulomyces angularis]
MITAPSWLSRSNKIQSQRSQVQKSSIPIRHIVPTKPRLEFVSGVPMVIMSRADSTSKLEQFDLKSMLYLKNSLDSKIKTLSLWFLENEEVLLKKSQKVLPSGKIFRFLNQHETELEFKNSTEASNYDLFALNEAISKSVSSNLFNITADQKTCQEIAAYLKASKVLALPRSVISISDWELFTYTKEHLTKSNLNNLIEKKEFLNSPLLNAILKCESEILEKFKLLFPLTFIDTTNEDPTQLRLKLVLYECLKFLFFMKSFNPNLNLNFFSGQELFNEKMHKFLEGSLNFNYNEEIDLSEKVYITGCCFSGIYSADEIIDKALVY